ncbi:PE domain-containing protein [Gandjariella thermophila]|uniref:PE domain-containing protein n=1 Tax=Gandjariella thermophila TaxID=1931992 RepID=A0A4D4J3W6_9PSEU|nr:PE domain-containing protein [Gandjariella thermophila]GDY29196.1 hypothetical protein GTS_08290 [Gandjariella thermophila]
MTQLDLGNGYSIDMADVDRFIKALEDTRANLNRTLTVTAQRLYVQPPGHDDYSEAFALTMNSVIDQHRQWNLARQNELQDLINRVKAARDRYLHVEQNNTPRV